MNFDRRPTRTLKKAEMSALLGTILVQESWHGWNTCLHGNSVTSTTVCRASYMTA